MKDRVDVAALVHRLAEGGEVVEVGVLQAAQENPDTGDAAQDARAGLGLGLAFVGLFVANMDVRVENPGQHRASGGVVGFGSGILQVVADHRDLPSAMPTSALS